MLTTSILAGDSLRERHCLLGLENGLGFCSSRMLLLLLLLLPPVHASVSTTYNFISNERREKKTVSSRFENSLFSSTTYAIG